MHVSRPRFLGSQVAPMVGWMNFLVTDSSWMVSTRVSPLFSFDPFGMGMGNGMASMGKDRL